MKANIVAQSRNVCTWSRSIGQIWTNASHVRRPSGYLSIRLIYQWNLHRLPCGLFGGTERETYSHFPVLVAVRMAFLGDMPVMNYAFYI